MCQIYKTYMEATNGQGETSGTNSLPVASTYTLENTSWPHAAILLLVERYRENQGLFESSTMKKMEVWRRTAAEMNRKGHSFTGDQCGKKMRSLKYRYKVIADNNSETGRGRRKWEYFQLMEELLAGGPVIRPEKTASSLLDDEVVRKEDNAGKKGKAKKRKQFMVFLLEGRAQ